MLTRPAGVATTVLLLALSAMPAHAQANDPPRKMDSGSSQGTAPAASSEDRAKPGQVRYCLMTEVSGTRMRRKLCLTKEEWAERGIDDPEK